MPVYAAKDCLSEVVGLKNDIVFKVFTCPDCKTDVTISRWQTQGELAIMCARCNLRYKVSASGDQVLADNVAGKEYFLERHDQGKLVQQNLGYKVFMGLDATQKTTPVPKDSFVNVMKPPVAKPAVAAAPRPAGAPAAPGAAPAAAAPKPAAPAAPAAKPEGDAPAA